MAKTNGNGNGETKNASRVEFDIRGISPISFGRAIQSIRATGEDHDAFEQRVWREKMHITEDGEVFVPPMMMKKCLESVAQYLSESVPGKGSSKFTKHFKAGILIVDPILIGVRADDVKPERLFVDAGGQPGGGKRVWRTFPTIPRWSGHVVVHLLDPILKAYYQKVEAYAKHAGSFIGLGRFAPRRGGFYGRFEVTSFEAFRE